jgi:hypothetical protein
MDKEPKVRFYFWEFAGKYGWRQLGVMSGYATLKELKKDCAFYMEKSPRTYENKYTILKATPINK